MQVGTRGRDRMGDGEGGGAGGMDRVTEHVMREQYPSLTILPRMK